MSSIFLPNPFYGEEYKELLEILDSFDISFISLILVTADALLNGEEVIDYYLEISVLDYYSNLLEETQDELVLLELAYNSKDLDIAQSIISNINVVKTSVKHFVNTLFSAWRDLQNKDFLLVIPRQAILKVNNRVITLIGDYDEDYRCTD